MLRASLHEQTISQGEGVAYLADRASCPLAFFQQRVCAEVCAIRGSSIGPTCLHCLEGMLRSLS